MRGWRGYVADDVRWALFQLRQSSVVSVANCPVLPAILRGRALRGARVRVASTTLVYGGQMVQGRGTLRVGAGAFVNHGCYFDTVANIDIGDGVFLSDHVRVLTSTHEIGTQTRRAGRLVGIPVTIGAGTWVGSGAVIMPGVRIGAGCIVGAGSLVTKDCDPDGVYVGSPAKRVRSLGDQSDHRE
ncbi:Acetyltransferase (Isoleucine patch superfamily) [Rhodococcus sp. AW25M09]|uniref:acyltransferase n=1 Tax=Rhodococcus sp. AW25M09 TaxID=1268303 RepID=UPI0002AC7011|nr:DapH/DapD/GlmU-related protein [Rhodococcus sp. AW25M09]CCQ17603.1 Acetyltransferase (Isoleucine patch superfamily) [Rhodococcus sp. AW25M09]